MSTFLVAGVANPTWERSKNTARHGQSSDLSRCFRTASAARRLAAQIRDGRVAGDIDRADGVGEDGGRHPRLGGSSLASARKHAETLGLVSADARIGRSDGTHGQRLVQHAQAGRGRRKQPASHARPRRACAHGRCRVGALARSSRAARDHRRHTGHAAKPCAHARLRLFARHLADGVRAAPRRRAVGVRRSAAHERGTRHFGPARSVSAMRGRSCRSKRRPSEPPSAQPVDLRDTRTELAPNRGLLPALSTGRQEALGSGAAAGGR